MCRCANPFTYHIPDGVGNGRLMPGSLVRVEFGVAMQPGVIVLGFSCRNGDPPDQARHRIA